MNRGGLRLTGGGDKGGSGGDNERGGGGDKHRILFYKTRSTQASLKDPRAIAKSMAQVRTWYDLTIDALARLMKHWRSNLSDDELRGLVDELEMVNRQRPKRSWSEMDALAESMAQMILDQRPTKRMRLMQGTKHKREDAEVDDLSERPEKRLRRHQGTKRRDRATEDEPKTKRSRTEEGKVSSAVDVIVLNPWIKVH
jgi:hypothetical protein